MFDLAVTVAGLLVGLVVGLTGMGGGALMTPVLVLLFGVSPLAAVSSDVVASLVIKPIGGGVHLRRGTVNGRMVLWLALGSVPAAFGGVLLLRALSPGPEVQGLVKTCLGVALLVVATGLVIRPLLVRGRQSLADAKVVVRPLPTLIIGVVGGVVVGVTSVGSGSLMIILLMLLYPRLKLSQLVGTDLCQAVPLVASASLGHLLFGQFQLALTASILVGAIPGVYIGARLSSRAPDHLIRPALVVVLSASALKLLDASGLVVFGVVGLAVAVSAWSLVRRRAAVVVPPAVPPADGGGLSPSGS